MATFVPQPKAGDQNKFLCSDGTWKNENIDKKFLCSNGYWLTANRTDKFLKGDGTWSNMRLIPTRSELESWSMDRIAELADYIATYTDTSDFDHLLNAQISFRSDKITSPIIYTARLVSFNQYQLAGIDQSVTGDYRDTKRNAGMTFQLTKDLNTFTLMQGTGRYTTSLMSVDSAIGASFFVNKGFIAKVLAKCIKGNTTNSANYDLTTQNVVVSFISPAYSEMWDSTQYGDEGKRFDIFTKSPEAKSGVSANDLRALGGKRYMTRTPCNSNAGWRIVTETGGATGNWINSSENVAVYPVFSVSKFAQKTG